MRRRRRAEWKGGLHPRQNATGAAKIAAAESAWLLRPPCGHPHHDLRHLRTRTTSNVLGHLIGGDDEVADQQCTQIYRAIMRFRAHESWLVRRGVYSPSHLRLDARLRVGRAHGLFRALAWR